MPWNDQGGGDDKGADRAADKGSGPWGSGPRRPWGAPPRQPPPNQTPDLEEILRRFGERMRGNGGGNGGGFKLGDGKRGVSWPLIAVLFMFGWLLTSVYFVNEGERAVILRFGKYDRTTGPGAHWHLPAPFEARMKFNVTAQQSDEIGCDRSSDTPCPYPQEGLMLTGDRNIVDIHFKVYYNISDVVAFAFNVRDPINVSRSDDRGAVGQVIESAMREVIGQRRLEAVITTDRASVEQEVQQLAQRILDEYGAGVQILQVQLLNATVPPDVIAAFNDVINANQDAETAVNEANRDSARITNEAQAYRERVIREATGEADRFDSVYSEYRASPRVTRDRIYTETMERVYGGANTIILDNGSGGVTYLPLDGLIRRGAAAPSAQQGSGQ